MFFVYLWIATQIIGELLPISSSGHLALLECFFKRNGFDIDHFFKQKNVDIKHFYYLLHVPTLLVITVYFAPQWFSMIFHNGIIDIQPIVWVMCADLITGILFLYKPSCIELFPIGLGFLVTAGIVLATGTCTGNKLVTSWHMSDAVILGFSQAIALLPGVSRLAMTCFVGCLLGYSLADAFCLSWLLQAPLMILAIAKSIALGADRVKLQRLLNIKTCLAIIVSSGISWIVLLLVVKMIHMQSWYMFGYYMILPIILYVICA